MKDVSLNKILLEGRARAFRQLRQGVPSYLPHYKGRKRKWEEEAWGEILEAGYVDPFSADESLELHWSLAFWVMRGMYEHYQWTDPGECDWESFLSLVQRRTLVRDGAVFVARSFPEVFRPDLTLWGDWTPALCPDGHDYKDEMALFQRVNILPRLLPTEAVEQAVEATVSHLAVALYIQKKTVSRHREMNWRDFRTSLESDPLAGQILFRQVGWMYAMNLETFRMLWESKQVTLPSMFGLKYLERRRLQQAQQAQQTPPAVGEDL